LPVWNLHAWWCNNFYWPCIVVPAFRWFQVILFLMAVKVSVLCQGFCIV
jgi:hypothetical protein